LRKKTVLSVLIASLLLVMTYQSVLADNYTDTFSLRVNTSKQLYHGQYWKYGLESVEIGNGCSLPSRDISEYYMYDITDYGSYEIVVHMHHYLNTDFATWERFCFEGKSANICWVGLDTGVSLEGIWVIDVYLYESGELVDKMHIVHNFQENPERLRFI